MGQGSSLLPLRLPVTSRETTAHCCGSAGRAPIAAMQGFRRLGPVCLLTLGLALAMLSACGDSSSPKSQGCHYNSDCPAELSCVAGECLKQCVADRDCPQGSVCVQGACAASEAGASGAPETTPSTAGDSGVSSEGGASTVTGSGMLAAPQTASADYLDKNDLTPVEFALLGAGTAPSDVPVRAFASEPSFYMQSALLTQPAGTGFLGHSGAQSKRRDSLANHRRQADRAPRFRAGRWQQLARSRVRGTRSLNSRSNCISTSSPART